MIMIIVIWSHDYPLYKGHHWGKEILASIERCPYFRGRFVLKSYFGTYQCGLRVSLHQGWVVKRGSTYIRGGLLRGVPLTSGVGC